MPVPAPRAARLRMCRLTPAEAEAVREALAAEGLTPWKASTSPGACGRVPVYSTTLRKALTGAPVRLDTADVILSSVFDPAP